jgi:hypothetical protein
MQQHVISATDIFLHVRVIIGIVLGLSITRLLTGTARFVQHPGKYKLYLVHLGWVAWMLLMLVHFWWWELWLQTITAWTFETYFFLIVYAILLFALCALLFPEDIAEYSGYEEFFISRRRWFFGILAAVFLFDLIDTLLKGREHFEAFGQEYLIRVPVYIALCCIAMVTKNRRFHAAFVIGSLVYEVSWILRQFNTLN